MRYRKTTSIRYISSQIKDLIQLDRDKDRDTEEIKINSFPITCQPQVYSISVADVFSLTRKYVYYDDEGNTDLSNCFSGELLKMNKYAFVNNRDLSISLSVFFLLFSLFSPFLFQKRNVI